MPPFDIQAFRTNATRSYHRSSHFMLEVSMPSGMRNIPQDQFKKIDEAWKTLSFEIESTNIPGVALGTDENRRQGFGPYTLRPYVSIFDTVSIIVRSDAEGKYYDFFQSWMKLISNYDSRSGITGTTGIGNTSVYEMSYPTDYTVDGKITIYDEEGKETLSVTMTKVFPIHLGNAIMDWGSNSILKFPVTLTFTDWFQGRTIGMTEEPRIPVEQ